MKFLGPSLPLQQEKKYIYAIDSDEVYMLTDERNVSESDRAISLRQAAGFQAYTLSALALTTENDYLIVDKAYENERDILVWQKEIYKKLGIQITDNIIFEQPGDFFKRSQVLAREGTHNIIVDFYSYRQLAYIQEHDKIAKSAFVNTKTNLPSLQKLTNFAIPKTYILERHQITEEKIKQLGFLPKSFYIKLDGVGNGKKVKKINEYQQLEKFLKTYEAEKIVLQQQVPDAYTECTLNFMLYPDHVYFHSLCYSLIDGTAWYGDYFKKGFEANSPSIITAGEKVAEAVRVSGYYDEEGLIMGIDGFTDGNDFLTTEINARWTGSITSIELLKRLNIYNKYDVSLLCDAVATNEIALYKKIFTENLFTPGAEQIFSVIPLGIGCTQGEASQAKNEVMFLVVGDFNAFATMIKKHFSAASFSSVEKTQEIVAKLA